MNFAIVSFFFFNSSFLQGAPTANIITLLNLASDMDRNPMGEPKTSKIIVSQWVQELRSPPSKTQIRLSVLVQERGRVEASIPDME